MKKSKEGTAPLFDGQAAAQATTNLQGVDPIAEMVGAIFDPIIVFPDTGWEDTLPDGIKKELPLHRLIHQMRCLSGQESWDEACDADALLYMYPLSLARPLGSDWSTIYIYLGTKVLGSKMPEDMAEKTLTDYQMRMLRDLKRWIYQKHLQHRRERARGEKQAPKQQPVEAQYEQIKLF